MSFDEFMTDTVTLIRKTGETVQNVKASVQSRHIMVMGSDVLIDAGDKIHRSMSNGGEETYEVIDPGFHESFGDLPAHYEIKYRKIGTQAANRQLSASNDSSVVPATKGEMKVFISHSNADREAAAALVELLRASLLLGSREVRCTSVDGYRLDAGANADEQLRQEIYDAEAFVALLSPDSMRSVYVMFELGARWGAKRPLLPVMVRGIEPGALKAPLSAIHAVRGTSEPDMHGLIQKLAECLGKQSEPPAVYHRTLGLFVEAAFPPS